MYHEYKRLKRLYQGGTSVIPVSSLDSLTIFPHLPPVSEEEYSDYWYTICVTKGFNMAAVPISSPSFPPLDNPSTQSYVLLSSRHITYNTSKKPGADVEVCKRSDIPLSDGPGTHMWNNWGNYYAYQHNVLLQCGVLDYRTGRITIISTGKKTISDIVEIHNMQDRSPSISSTLVLHLSLGDIRLVRDSRSHDTIHYAIRALSIVTFQVKDPVTLDIDLIDIKFYQSRNRDLYNSVILSVGDTTPTIVSDWFRNNALTVVRTRTNPEYPDLLSVEPIEVARLCETHGDDVSMKLREGVPGLLPQYSMSTNLFYYGTKIFMVGHVKISCKDPCPDTSLFLAIQKHFQKKDSPIEYWGKSTTFPCYWEIYMAVLYQIEYSEEEPQKIQLRISDCFYPLNTDPNKEFSFSLFFPMSAWAVGDRLIMSGGEGDHYGVLCSCSLKMLLEKVTMHTPEDLVTRGPRYFEINKSGLTEISRDT